MLGRFSAMDISASGLAAERMRMEITANNIANANTTQTPDGTPYRKQNVVFASMINSSSGNFSSVSELGGVRVAGIEEDDGEFPLIYNPTHPHADKETGMLRMPNVQVPNEMVDLITASRSYEANLKSITLFKDMVEQTLNLLRGGQ